jgi:hypothetical protein
VDTQASVHTAGASAAAANRHLQLPGLLLRLLLLLLACVFAAMSGPFETYGGAMTSCFMCLHWHSVATPAADNAMLLLSSTRLHRFFSLQSVSVTSAEKGRSHTSSFASEMTWRQQQQQQRPVCLVRRRLHDHAKKPGQDKVQLAGRHAGCAGRRHADVRADMGDYPNTGQTGVQRCFDYAVVISTGSDECLI